MKDLSEDGVPHGSRGTVRSISRRAAPPVMPELLWIRAKEMSTRLPANPHTKNFVLVCLVKKSFISSLFLRIFAILETL